MKLNKISRALRLSTINLQPKSAIYSSALLTLLASPVFAQDENEAIEVATPTSQVTTQVSDLIENISGASAHHQSDRLLIAIT